MVVRPLASPERSIDTHSWPIVFIDEKITIIVGMAKIIPFAISMSL
jgi:hypothetical protein